MKFILKFEGNTKEVRHRKSESVDSQNSVKSYPSNESGIAHTGWSEKTAWEIRCFTRLIVIVCVSVSVFSLSLSSVFDRSDKFWEENEEIKNQSKNRQPKWYS